MTQGPINIKFTLSLYQALDYSYNPMKTKLFYCSTSNGVNITVHYVWMQRKFHWHILANRIALKGSVAPKRI